MSFGLAVDGEFKISGEDVWIGVVAMVNMTRFYDSEWLVDGRDE